MTLRRQTILIAMAAGMIFPPWHRETHAESPPPQPPPKVVGPIEYVGPDTYVLVDAEGRPQPVLGMTYDEFVAAWKRLQNVESSVAEPRFTIDELRVSGQAEGDHAELHVETTIRTTSAGPLKVPLGMASAILKEQPTWEIVRAGKIRPGAAAGAAVDYDPQAGGFVARIDGRPDARHKLSVDMLVPLVRDGNETSLRLNFPRALVSKLTLAVPTAIIDATVSAGTVLKKEASRDGVTQMIADGLAGDFRLTWNNAEGERRELATVLSATGAIAIAIDGHSIRSDAHLSVRSYGGSFDRFRVRLPPGAQLIQDQPHDLGAAPPGYRISVVGEASAAEGAAQIATVELTEKQAGPVEVNLSTEQPLGIPSEERAVELAGFDVLGAVRQFGDVAIHVADDWQLRWESGPYLRQVERSDLPPALRATTLRDPQPTAAFQYDRQPWSLRARVVSRPMVVHVAPDYALELGADEARLHAHLIYQIPGARAFVFHVQLQGWELTPDPIESNGLVDRDGVTVTRDGMLVMPLAQASSRRAEITLELRRSLPRETTALELPLPIPEADSVAAADLAVSAAPEVELLPDMSRSRALAPTPVTSDTPPQTSADQRQEFHYRALAPDAVFAAQRTIRPSEIAAKIETTLSLDREQLHARQDVSYTVEYQPVEQLAFDIPASWSIVDDQIEILPAAGSAPIVVAVRPVTTPTEKSRRQVHVDLPQPRLGNFGVRLKFADAEYAESQETRSLHLTLPQPAGVRLTDSRVTVASEPELAVSLDPSVGSTWQRVEVANGNSATVLVAAKPHAELPLVVESVSPDRPQTTIIERAWLQTWQVGNTIQDRSAYRFRTGGTAATIELPPLVSADEVEVQVDGRLARVWARQAGRLLVELPPIQQPIGAVATRTLEVRYRRPATVGLVTPQEFTPPQLVGSSTLSEIYWQIILPGDRHIVGAPAQLVPVDSWQWLEVLSGRRSTTTQAELEAWAGATKQLAPSAAQNIYLFSGLAPIASIEVLTAPRWLIVLAASGGLLAVALLWMYVPLVRRGWIGLLAAAVVATLAVSFPELAELVAQAAVLGVILSAVAVVLRRRLARPARQPPSTAGSTNLRVRSSYRPDSMVTPALGPSASVSPSLPVAVPESDR